jgi:hypothetical protein
MNDVVMGSRCLLAKAIILETFDLEIDVQQVLLTPSPMEVDLTAIALNVESWCIGMLLTSPAVYSYAYGRRVRMHRSQDENGVLDSGVFVRTTCPIPSGHKVSREQHASRRMISTILCRSVGACQISCQRNEAHQGVTRDLGSNPNHPNTA